MATITLIEDDQLLADCYTRWLQAGGHQVYHAIDAQSALDSIDAYPPHLILLDMLLPGANGMQLLHTLQSHTDLADIPVVVCSGALAPGMYDLRPYGVRAVLDKATLTRRTLQSAVQEAL